MYIRRKESPRREKSYQDLTYMINVVIRARKKEWFACLIEIVPVQFSKDYRDDHLENTHYHHTNII